MLMAAYQKQQNRKKVILRCIILTFRLCDGGNINFYDFRCFWSIAINIVDKLSLKNIYSDYRWWIQASTT